MRSGVFPDMSQNQVGKENSKDINYMLMGTFISGNFKEALFFDSRVKKLIKVREGERLGVYIVSKVLPGEAILSSANGDVKLVVFSKNSSKARTHLAKFVKAPLKQAVIESGSSGKRHPIGKDIKKVKINRKTLRNKPSPKNSTFENVQASKQPLNIFLKQRKGQTTNENSPAARAFLKLIKSLQRRKPKK